MCSSELVDLPGLRYVNNSEPGYLRFKSGKGFRYVDPKGNNVKDEKLKERFKDLVIPPGWKDVWICKNKNGHIQATGFDEKGRKQYIYHPEWKKVRDEKKFERMFQFGNSLTQLRNQIKSDLRKNKLIKEKIIALVVKIMDETLMRVGNKKYEEENKTHGVTTLRKKHLKTNDSNEIVFEYVGKSGQEREIDLKDKKIKSLLDECNQLPGQYLFKYVNEDNNYCSVTSDDINNYLKEHTGVNFTAKDFRTWGGSVTAIKNFLNAASSDEETKSEETKSKQIVSVINKTAEELGNTTAVTKEHYIHPSIITAFEKDTLKNFYRKAKRSKAKKWSELTIEEKTFLILLKNQNN